MHPQRGDLGPPEDEPGVHTFEIDPGLYLPEGVELAADDPEADAPEADEDPEGPTGDANPADATEATGSVEPGGDDPVDTSVLERIEGELDEVDAALAAIDAGRPESSALLHRLLDDAEVDESEVDDDPDTGPDEHGGGVRAEAIDPAD